MYPYLESLALQDGKIRLLSYHQDRLNKTFLEFYPNNKPLDLEKIFSIVTFPTDQKLYKIRFLYNAAQYKIEIEAYKEKTVENFYLIEREMDYNYKFTDRVNLESVYKLLPDKNADFIITIKGCISDSFYANLIFFDGENWFTPKTYLLNGTMRQFLLNEKKITEKSIKIEDLKKYKSFKRINALLTFQDSQLYNINQISFLDARISPNSEKK